MTYTMRSKGREIKIDTTNEMITGSTYQLKDTIKYEFDDCVWDAASKAWRVSGLAQQIKQSMSRLQRLYGLTEIADSYDMDAAVEAPRTSSKRSFSGLCPICHTYCNGDCTASR